MNCIEKEVARHYGEADLLERILTGLEANGIDLNSIQPEDLAPIEEFHIGGRIATKRAVEKMLLKKDDHVLDIGCGIGGAVRYITSQVGCYVSGIDLTPEYIHVAQSLTDYVGLSDKVNYEVASALDMPFGNEVFDAAITMHVAMNIKNREQLYYEIARVMKSGATLCIYDVMKKSDENITFPLPWAQSVATSHLTTPAVMGILLDDAGFEIQEIEDRTDFAIEFFKESLVAASNKLPSLGLHTIMGASAREKFKNTLLNIESGCIAPVQIIATRKE